MMPRGLSGAAAATAAAMAPLLAAAAGRYIDICLTAAAGRPGRASPAAFAVCSVRRQAESIRLKATAEAESIQLLATAQAISP